MKVTERTPVGDIVAKHPRTANVFERHRVDFCCGGDQMLQEACDAAGAETQTVLAEIIQVTLETSPDRDWTGSGLADLVAHILAAYHAPLHAELPVLDDRLQKVIAAHGERHGASLSALAREFGALRQELELHLQKEEQVLFPAIERCEHAALEGAHSPGADCRQLRHPIAVMEQEHEAAGRALRAMRDATSGYAVPADGCTTYRALFDGLMRLEADLHRHIHLENNILFPRAIGLGAALE